MKYEDIKPLRHAILAQMKELQRQLDELDAPIIAKMAATDEYQRWANPSGVAALDLKKMHKKHDPK